MKKVSLILAIAFSVISVFLFLSLFVEYATGTIVLAILFLIPAIVFWIIRLITINKSKQKSNCLTVDLKKYDTDATYRENIIKKVNKKADKDYNDTLIMANQRLNNLKSYRANELRRLENARWETESKIKINKEEGKVLINKTAYLFSDIKDVEIKCVLSGRSEAKYKERTTSSASAHETMFGNVVGVGAGVSRGNIKEHDIPTCEHLGVVVNLNGFFNEIVLINRTTDLSDRKYNNLENEARTLEYRLKELSTVPVPEYVQPLEELPSIVAVDSEIEKAQNDYRTIYNTKPDYKAILEETLQANRH